MLGMIILLPSSGWKSKPSLLVFLNEPEYRESTFIANISIILPDYTE
jgi:hypothetical protein